MGKVAFELRADAKDKFSGGSVSLPQGRAFDVGEALTEGNGKIVLDPDPAEIEGKSAEAQKKRDKEAERARHDAAVIDALGAFPALKQATVGDAPAASSQPAADDRKES